MHTHGPRAAALLAALIALALTLTGCRYPRTEVLVEITTNLPAGPTGVLRSVEIEVRSNDAAGTLRERREYVLTDGQTTLPMSFGVHPLRSDSEGARVRVRACGAQGCGRVDGVVVERLATVAFVPGQTRRLRMELVGDCSYVRCEAGQACDPDVGFCAPPSSRTEAVDESGDAGGLVNTVTSRPSITAGGGYSCARDADGGVKCWGGSGGLLDYERMPGFEGTGAGVAGVVPGLPAGVVSVNAGYGHACGLGSDGAVWCWGRNEFGQLGDGTREARSGAVRVAGLPGGVAVEVRAGQGFSCVRVADGTVWCWGRMDELFYPSLATSRFVPDALPVLDSPTPVAVTGVSSALEIAAGEDFACARVLDGSVWCWGSGVGGELGTREQAARAFALPVVGLTDAAGITAGGLHACARRRDGTLWCWGNNDYGQLGDGSEVTRFTPVAVMGLDGVVSVDAGRFHTCARRIDGTALCWGRNDSGQLGDDARADRDAPAPLASLAGVSELRAGAEHTCARVVAASGAGGTLAETVRCWGSDAAGELGSGRALWGSTPRRVDAGGQPFGSVGALGAQTCGLVGGVASCWGLTLSGDHVARQGFINQEGPRAAASLPTRVPGLAAPVVDVANGPAVTCALLASGKVYCAGDNRFANLGRASPERSAEPLEVPGLDNVVQVATTYLHVCALRNDGTLYCWGQNAAGELGTGQVSDARPTPARVEAITNVKQVAAGGEFTCALRDDGTVWCWGRNDGGQLGAGAALSGGSFSFSPVRVEGLDDVVQIAANVSFACAVKRDGTVWCWGEGPQGELGTTDGVGLDQCTNTNAFCAPAPVIVRALGGAAVAVTAGQSHACALMADHSVRCWGDNRGGQLGRGPNGSNSPLPPQPVVTDPGVGFEQISAGTGYTCGLTLDHRMLCWGTGRLGEIGQPDRPVAAPSPLPVDVGGGMRLRKVNAQQTTCAITESSQLYCWGMNVFGQAGDGTLNPTEPVTVQGLRDPRAVVATTGVTYVLQGDGTVVAWGENGAGQLGNGETRPSLVPVPVSGLSDVVQVSSEYSKACAVRSDGTVACWGTNDFGSLGPGATGPFATSPVDVPGLDHVQEVRASGSNVCARRDDGSIWCWGANYFGDLGDGSMVLARTVPAPVTGLTGAVGLASDGAGFCAFDAAGAMYCWGAGVDDLLGSEVPSSMCMGQLCARTPTRVRIDVHNFGPEGGAVRQVAGHGPNLCAVVEGNSERRAYCWGTNDVGQLGAGTEGGPQPPTQVLGLADVEKVDVGGNFACALLRGTGQVACWGFNYLFETGAPYLPGSGGYVSPQPYVLTSFDGAVDVIAGDDHACARLADGRVLCWGANQFGQLGTGHAQSILTPGAFHGLAPPERVEPGAGFGCALAQGTVFCWGANAVGQLGIPDLGHTDAALVPSLSGVEDLAVGASHGCTLAGGHIQCWGDNTFGELGVGSASVFFSSTPLGVFSSRWDPVQLSAGGDHTCALAADRQAFCWGADDRGQLGYQPPDMCSLQPCYDQACTGRHAPCATTPHPVPGLSDLARVSAGGAHTCALTTGGAVFCWGANDRGQLGDGSRQDRGSPSAAPLLTGAVTLSAGTDVRCTFPSDRAPQCMPTGQDHTCAVDSQGAVWCWGANDRGQCGAAGSADVLLPQRVDGISGAIEVTAGGAHTCARTQSNELWCWGDDGYGQLGSGAAVTRAEPGPVSGL